MAARDQKLLGEIEAGALDEGTPVATVLRKCLALGGRAGSAELRSWARQELNGYDEREDLPRYRIVPAQIKVNAVLGYNQINGQTIGPHSLPDFAQEKIKEEVPLFAGIGTIENMIREGGPGETHIRLSLPYASTLMALMNQQMDEFEQITALNWVISKVSLRNVVDKVRNTCTELVAELHANTPVGQSMPSGEVVDQAIQFAVSGRRNTITVVNAPVSGIGNITQPPRPVVLSRPDSPWQRWRRRGVVVGLSTFVAAVAAVVTWLDWTPWK